MKLNRVLALALAAACLLALSACRPKQEDGSAASGSSSAESSAGTSQAPAASLPDGSEPNASQPEPAPAPQEPEQPAPPPIPKPKPKPQPKPVPEAPKEISFPYAIPDSTLVVEAVHSYDGIFLEDGSDTPIQGVAAVVVKNTGKQVVDYARLHLDGSKTDLDFEFSGLDAGASIVAMEKNKAPAVSQSYASITADAAYTDGFELSTGALLVEETSEGKLKVSNQSKSDIPCARVFYKFYLADKNTFVGGITYVAKLVDLKAGTSVEVLPSHYAAGNSRVIMAKVYETAED